MDQFGGTKLTPVEKKEKFTTVHPGCCCHATSECIGCSISNLVCRLDSLVKALGNHDANGIVFQFGSQIKRLMSHLARSSEPNFQDLGLFRLCRSPAVAASELCSSKGEWFDLVHFRFGLIHLPAQLVDSIGTQKVSSVTRAFLRFET